MCSSCQKLHWHATNDELFFSALSSVLLLTSLRLCPFPECINLCFTARALWREELVWRAVFWGLLHSLLPTRNNAFLWKVKQILLFTLLRAEFLLWLLRKWNTVTKGPAKAKKLFPSELFTVVCAMQYLQWIPLETPKPLRKHIWDRWRVSTDCIGGASGSGGAQELLSMSSMGWHHLSQNSSGLSMQKHHSHSTVRAG